MGKKIDAVVFLLVICLAFLLGYNLVYKYNLGRIAAIKAQAEEEGKKNALLGQIAALDAKAQAYRQRSFPNTEITQLLDRVSQAARSANIAIETYNPLPVLEKEDYIELSVRIPLRCDYHQLGGFLSQIESNQEFIWVKELNMQKSATAEPGGRSPQIDVVISGLVLKK